ncbi:MAG: DUF4893 domain-containing protein [Pseudomarimonas sp.]
MTSIALRIAVFFVLLAACVAGYGVARASDSPRIDPITLTVLALTGSADGEDVTQVVYFHAAGVDFQLGGDGDEVGALQQLIIYQPQEDDATPYPRITLTRGQRFLPDQVYSSEDGSLLVVGLQLRKQRQWWVIDTQTVKVIAELRPRQVVITDATARISEGSDVLRAAITRVVPLQAWQRLLWAEDQTAVLDARQIADDWLQQVPTADFDAAALALARELLAAEPQPIDARKLLGNWRVRSLQTNTLGAYLYGFFNAEISQRDEFLQLRKSSGSQRRLGLLYPVRDEPTTMVFLGASSVNEEPQVGYSRGYSGVNAPERLSSDSVGRFFQLGSDRLLLILDPQWGQGFELYELKRP